MNRSVRPNHAILLVIVGPVVTRLVHGLHYGRPIVRYTNSRTTPPVSLSNNVQVAAHHSIQLIGPVYNAVLQIPDPQSHPIGLQCKLQQFVPIPRLFDGPGSLLGNPAVDVCPVSPFPQFHQIQQGPLLGKAPNGHPIRIETSRNMAIRPASRHLQWRIAPETW